MESEAAADVPHFVAFIGASPRRVLPVFVTLGAGSLLSRRRVEMEDGFPLRAALLIALAPPLLNLLTFIVGSRACSGLTFLWLFYYAVINFLLLWFPWLCWRRIVQQGADLGELLGTDQNRALCREWLSGHMNVWRQALGSMAGGLIGALLLGAVAGPLHSQFNFQWQGYLSMWLTVALGIGSVHWICTVTYLPWKLTRMQGLRFRPLDPVSTPGLTKLGQVLKIGPLHCDWNLHGRRDGQLRTPDCSSRLDGNDAVLDMHRNDD